MTASKVSCRMETISLLSKVPLSQCNSNKDSVPEFCRLQTCRPQRSSWSSTSTLTSGNENSQGKRGVTSERNRHDGYISLRGKWWRSSPLHPTPLRVFCGFTATLCLLDLWAPLCIVLEFCQVCLDKIHPRPTRQWIRSGRIAKPLPLPSWLFS